MNSNFDFPPKKTTFLVVLAAIVTATTSIYALEWLATQSAPSFEKGEEKSN